MTTQTLSYSQLIQAPAKQIYRAFTNSTSLRQWLCDVATTRPEKGGRFYLSWTAGYFAAGEYTQLEPDTKVAFTWRGRGEPEATNVVVSILPQDGGALLTLEHSSIGSGAEWSQAVKEIGDGWKNGLENLKSVLETGEDLRFVLRPMLGITLSDFDAEVAKKLGVPVTKGIRLDNVVAGMGAQAAGLQGNDVVVSLNDHAVDNWTLPDALRGRRAGDKVEVTFYRGSEKKTVSMELSRRPLPEIIWNPVELAMTLRERYDGIAATLAEFLEGVTEEQADFHPAPSEWSVKEVLAHLIHGERGWQQFLSDRIGGQEPHYDDYGGNLQARVEATVAVYPRLQDLQAALRQASIETVELFARIPEEFVANKVSYWHTAYEALEQNYHFDAHREQMQKAIQAAPK